MGRVVMTCTFCGQKITGLVWREVTGMVATNRKAGGSNAIRLPVWGEVFACNACVLLESGKRVSRVNPGQLGLDDVG